MSAPTLTGLAPAITLDANTLNVTPQRLHAGMTFADAEHDFDRGSLDLTGLLTPDRVSTRNEGVPIDRSPMNDAVRPSPQARSDHAGPSIPHKPADLGSL